MKTSAGKTRQLIAKEKLNTAKQGIEMCAIVLQERTISLSAALKKLPKTDKNESLCLYGGIAAMTGILKDIALIASFSGVDLQTKSIEALRKEARAALTFLDGGAKPKTWKSRK